MSHIYMSKKYQYNYKALENKEFFYYLLGVVFTDGSLSYNKRRTNSVQLSISSCDLDWLQLIRENINGGNITSNNKNCYILNISDGKFISKFVKNGLIPNKSLVLECPIIPKKYIRHFLRGVIDGDGSIGFGINSPNIAKLVICSASLSFINGLSKMISVLGVDTKIYTQKQKDHMINGRLIHSDNLLYRVSLSRWKAYKIVSQLEYDKKIALPRKAILAKAMVEYYSNISKSFINKRRRILDLFKIKETREIAKELNICRKEIGKIINLAGYKWDNSKKQWIQIKCLSAESVEKSLIRYLQQKGPRAD